MSIKRIIAAIPARLESSRLPNKVLADIGGIPMLKRVLDQCKKVDMLNCIVVCTDNVKIQKLVKEWGHNVIMTSTECSSGSERIASVINQIVGLAWNNNYGEQKQKDILDQTAVINIQGDQPFLNPLTIELLIREFHNKEYIPDVITPVYKLKPDNIHNPAVVKTLLKKNGQAIYFSRAAIPYVRGVDPKEWHLFSNFWGHVGIYGYRGDILAKWNEMSCSTLEDIERLEQLRVIEYGYSIDTFKVNGTSLSVDTSEQLEEARLIAKKIK